ncbi:PREDICTED: DNA repair protein UVH3 isoform X1 [Lupinus angustifolius]|uniref:DNA repair protein UVH3 isoform X1 n=1 Tax=Lupinus angustifolius TaxID=3871 RepID=UPI00092FADEB|nr:PREDICTED: DNA repair protein UVH3 isoform X1 [Lupinus angustifolius]
MGVHGLWELLSPVGRRVSVESLAGKTLAVDASIWMVQFLKAMRDEKGEMIRNAHLLGFFRRICKLLFLRIKPVFIFDGGTPALKRRTVIARRRQRENAQAKVRKTAEKLLLNHLKALRLKELADDIKNQRLKPKNDTKSQKKSDKMDCIDNDSGKRNMKELDEMSASKEERNLSQTITSTICNQEKLDEMLAASIAAEENGILSRNEASSSYVANPSEEECVADEEMILLKGKKKGLMNEVENQKQHKVIDKDKGKGILSCETDMVGCSPRCDILTSKSDNQDKLDEMLAASIALEENARNTTSISLEASTTIEEEDGGYNEDEEMILPPMHGEIDPVVLASLPPSMQLDLLVQMRERLIAENRQKYQKVKKDPAKFSELQIQAYLKTVTFRREIDEVQKAAAGRGVGGVQTSRIASEANREYIFSSSFMGDKQELTSNRLGKIKDAPLEARGTHPSQKFVNNIAVVTGDDSNTSSGFACYEPDDHVDDSIQTYRDESGRIRVSRSRAMGMCMTRDLQRNLDMMKEIEQERTYVNRASNNNTVLNAENNAPFENSGIQLPCNSQEMNVDLVRENFQNEQSMLDRDTSIEISFEYDCRSKFSDGEDDIFASLVGRNSREIFCANDMAGKEQISDSDSDFNLEEGIIEDKNTNLCEENKVELISSIADGDNNDESEVEWEDGDCDGAKSTLLSPFESEKVASRGCLEEESDLQEAIRRSLDSIGDGEPKHMSSVDERSTADENKLGHGEDNDVNPDCPGPIDLNDNVGFLNNNTNNTGDSTLPREDNTEQNELPEIVDGDEKHDFMARNNPQTLHFPGGQSNSSLSFNFKDKEPLVDKPCILDARSRPEGSTSDANATTEDEINMVVEQLSDNTLGVTKEEKTTYINESVPLSNFNDNTKPVIPLTESSLKGSTEDLNMEPKLLAVDNDRTFYVGGNNNLAKDAVKTSGDLPANVAEIRLEEEMRVLDQEYIELQNEQRNLERNAESVNSEVFAECQELLQMFGLPYIIAPMEAEAQCAYLELAKLVDGVVTDDSDVLLFGARSVYKNIFDDRKYVETYFMEDIEKELGLTREKIVRMALLLGSDYTEGVSGIGIVNAIEVLNAFPEEDGLVKFRQWVESPDPTILGRLDAKSGSKTKKRGSEVEEKINVSKSNIEESALDPHAPEQKESLDCVQEIKKTFFHKHRNVSKNWHIPSSFPSETVMSAYYSPQVDKSIEPFTWGKPDHLVLRKLCWEKFGWVSQKADELLLPVLKEYNKHETQLRLEAFYSFNERFAKIRSKRIKKAVKGITGKQPADLTDNSLDDLNKSGKNERRSSVEPGDYKSDDSKGTGEGLESRKKSNTKKSNKRKNNGDTFGKARSRTKKISDGRSAPGTSEVENLHACMQTEEEQCDVKELIRNRSGRGRGRGRSLGVKRGRGNECRGFQSRETSSSSSDTVDHVPSVHPDVSKFPQEVRRSTRSRKPVKYSLNDLEVEDSDDAFDKINQPFLHDEPAEETVSDIHGRCGEAATDLSRGKETSEADIPVKDNLPRENFQSESSFHTDDNSSDYYLKIGGGFCLDDSNTTNNDDAIDVNTATADYTADLPSCSDFFDETIRNKNSSDVLFSGTEKAETEVQDGNKEVNDDLLNADSEMGVLKPENTNENSGISMGAFSAIPFLKKRRMN